MPIALTTPDYYARQQVGGQATFNLTGTYTGSPTTIEYSSDGVNFFTGDATPSGGTFDFPITLLTGQYTITVRFSNDIGDTDSIVFVTVGDGFLMVGQSNPSGRGINNQTYTQGTYKAILVGNDDVFKEMVDPYDSDVNQVDTVSSDASAAGSWIMRFCDKWAGGKDTPIFIIPCAKGGTRIVQWLTGNPLYTSAIRRAALTGGVSQVIFQLGGSDCANLTLATAYESDLNELADSFQTDLGVGTTIVPLQGLDPSFDGDGVTTGQVPIRAAQNNAAATNANIEITGPTNQIDIINGPDADGVHIRTDAQLDEVANIAFKKLGNVSTTFGYGFTKTLPTIADSHTEFPVILTEDSFPAEAVNGGETSIPNGGGSLIAYTDNTKTTRLPVHVKAFITGNSPQVEVYVKTTASTGNTIYIENDAVQTSQPAVTDTFGRNAVWSFYEFVSLEGEEDSTGNYPGAFTITGTPTATTGPYGTVDAYDFDGGNDFIDPDVSSRDPINDLTGTSEITFELWANDVRSTINQRAMALHGSTTNFAAFGMNYGSGATSFFIGANDSNATDVAWKALATNTASSFYGGSMSLNATSLAPITVQDGVEISNASAPNLGDGSTSRSLRLGGRNDDSNDSNGIFSKFRYARQGSSANRLITSQDNQKDDGNWGTSSAWASQSGTITITEATVNSNYASLDPVVTLTSSISITESLVNASYTSLSPNITLTGSISIAEQVTNTNYTSLNPGITLTGITQVTESTTNTSYNSLNPVITLTSTAIQIEEQTVNVQYNTLNPSILLTPEPLGIVSTVCFDGSIKSVSFNGYGVELAYNGNFNELEFNGTIQVNCSNGSIKTNC